MHIRRAIFLWITLLYSLSILCTSPVWAQVPDDGPTSICFSAPDSTQPVRDYRLPSWHWSRWTLLGNGSADWTSSKRELQDQSTYSSRLSVNPAYEGFWESEEQKASLAFSPAVSIRRRGASSDSDTFGEKEQDQSGYRLSFDGKGTLREYVSGQTFLLVEGGGNVSYRRNRKEPGPDGITQTQIRSNVNVDTRIGVGVGRVRIVTPVLRALRVRERLRAVAPGASLSDDQVQEAAQQLARRPGYEAVYDRPDKTFWRDFFERAQVGEPTVFESFYIADVLREPVGVRREGAELVAGPTGRYHRHVSRTEQNGRLHQRYPIKSKSVGGFVQGRWYQNVSLGHQVGADVEATYNYFIETDPLVDYDLGVDAQGQWMWVLADRVRLDNRVYTNLSFRHNHSEDGFRIDRSHAVSSDLRVFVENRLSLSVGATLSYSYREEASGSSNSGMDTGIQFGINYVLSRSLK